MPARTVEERAASRAEARRRARLAARGLLPEDEPQEADAEPTAARRGGFLTRMFPPAPPLPNRRDPLERFNRDAPLRWLREPLYLLARNPAAWMLTSLTCFVGYFLVVRFPTDFVGMIGTFVMFGSIIAAGWFGWQRPSLFGAVTALIGQTLIWLVLLATVSSLAGELFAIGDPIQTVLAFAFQVALGFIGGWYGGYLRRRQAAVSAERQPSSGRRRR